MDYLGLFVVSITLFTGGIYLLSLRIPFWSLFFGAASIQIGIVLIILSFESFIKRSSKAITEDYKVISCLICKRPVYVPKFQRTIICDECQIKIANSAKLFMVLLFSIFSITSGVYLIRSNQDIREKASNAEYVCDQGTWDPQDCRCGYKGDFSCPDKEIAKICTNNHKYCCTESKTLNAGWECKLSE